MQRRWLLILGGLLPSCASEEGLNREHPGMSFTFYPAAAGLLRARNTDGQGVRTLAFFPTNGGKPEEITLHNEPFVIRNWAGDVVTISYRTSYEKRFLPWFKTRNNKPTALGEQRLEYAYEVVSESSSVTAVAVDSFHVDARRGRIGFFAHGQELDAYPVQLVNLYFDKAEVFSPDTHLVKDYLPANEAVIRKCIYDITKAYK